MTDEQLDKLIGAIQGNTCRLQGIEAHLQNVGSQLEDIGAYLSGMETSDYGEGIDGIACELSEIKTTITSVGKAIIETI